MIEHQAQISSVSKSKHIWKKNILDHIVSFLKIGQT